MSRDELPSRSDRDPNGGGKWQDGLPSHLLKSLGPETKTNTKQSGRRAAVAPSQGAGEAAPGGCTSTPAGLQASTEQVHRCEVCSAHFKTRKGLNVHVALKHRSPRPKSYGTRVFFRTNTESETKSGVSGRSKAAERVRVERMSPRNGDSPMLSQPGGSGSEATPGHLTQSGRQRSPAPKRTKGQHRLESEVDAVSAVTPELESDEAPRIRHHDSELDQPGLVRPGRAEGRDALKGSPLSRHDWCGTASTERAEPGSNGDFHVREADHSKEDSQAPSGQRATIGETNADLPIEQSVSLHQGVRPRSERPALQRPLDSGEVASTSRGAFCDTDGREPKPTKGRIVPHLACRECGAAFTTQRGVSLHMRKRHFAAYNASIVTTRIKARWSDEEEYLMASCEVVLAQKGTKNLNTRLAELFKDRTLEAIKARRRSPRYRALVAEIGAREGADASPHVQRQNIREQPQGASTSRPAGTSAPEDTESNIPEPDSREAIVKELEGLVRKPPPQVYEAPRLWEIVKRQLEGQNVAMEVNNYIREVLQKDHRKQQRQHNPPKETSRRRDKKRLYAETQERFKKRQSECAREVLDGKVSADVADPKKLLAEWRSIMEAAPTGTVTPDVVIEDSIRYDPFGVFTAQDIKAAMLPLSSAAGPDGLTPKELRQIPSVVLRVLLNTLQLLKRIPVCLRNARTVVIPKRVGAAQAADFRPITVSSVLLRLMHKVYARRIQSAVTLDYRQRAFIPADGCAENVVILATALEEAKGGKKPLCMASVDVAKAFDRVDLQAILRGLRRKGISDDFLNYIQDFYTTATTVLQYGNESLLVHPTIGVRQGDPLSPLLFNLVIDEWLATCDPNIRFKGETVDVNCMAFADDIVILAATPRGLQDQLSALEQFLTARGLQVNPAKSLSLTILPSGKDKVSKIDTTHAYTINGEPIPQASSTTCWRYLGIRFNATGKERDRPGTEVKSLLESVSKAPLKPQQRLVVLKYYLLPRLYHRLVLGPVSAKALLKLDCQVRSYVRKWLALPQDTPLGFYYAPTPEGGLGIPCVRTLIPALRVKRLKSLENSDSLLCRTVATSAHVKGSLAQAERLCTFRGCRLNGRMDSQKYWTKCLHESVDGRALKDSSNAPGSTAWISEGTTFLRGREYIDLVKMHINAVPTLSRLRRGRQETTKCRAGCPVPETLGHVLQKCHRTHHERIRRHDVLVRYVAKRLREKGWQVMEEQRFKTAVGTRIPDLVCKRDKERVLLDAQVVGTRVSLSDAHLAKTAKYMEPSLLQQVGEGLRTLVSSITLSFRGGWARESAKTLVDLGLGRNDLKVLSVRCLQGGMRGFWVHQKTTRV